MKKLVLASAAVAALLATPAMAADLPVKAPPIVAPAPYNWTGFYVGGNLGYGTSTKHWNDIFATTGLETGWLVSTKPDGFLGGVQGGYNYQVGRWVFGVEGQVSWTDMKGSAHWLEPGGAVSPAFTAHTDIHWLTSLTGRLGVAWDRALLYAKGGAAWIDEGHWQEDNGVPQTPVVSGTRTGWTVGGGIEYAFWDHWSAKIEYNYMDFGSHRYFFAIADGRFSDIEQKVQIVQAGINYKF